MSGAFAKPVEPERLARSGEVLEGRVPIVELARLCRELLRPDGEATCSVRFYRGDGSDSSARGPGQPSAGGHIRMAGTVETAVTLECQTCLEAVLIPVSAHFDMALVEHLDESVEAMPDLDVWHREARLLDLRAVFEEEILLGLPQVARHPERVGCGALAENEVLLPADQAPEPEAPGSEPTRKPFRDLGRLTGASRKRRKD